MHAVLRLVEVFVLGQTKNIQFATPELGNRFGEWNAVDLNPVQDKSLHRNRLSSEVEKRDLAESAVSATSKHSNRRNLLAELSSSCT